MVTRSDMRVSRSRYLFASLVIPKLLVALKERIWGPGETVPRVPPQAVNRLFEAWLRVDAAFGAWLPLGTSVFLVAQPAERGGQ